MSRRRGSRLFLGHPGMLLVSEDIPGITMPAPPVNMPPLEDEEPDFDLFSFRQEEDQEAAAENHDGPLRVFLGNEQEATPVFADEDDGAPVFDVSALAMPAGPYAETTAEDDFDADAPLQFLDDDDAFDEADVVQVDGTAPPAISMGVSSAVSLDATWDDGPTNPNASGDGGPSTEGGTSTAYIRDTPPPVVYANGDPSDLPEDPFAFEGEEATPALAIEDEPTSLEPGAPSHVVWDDDDTGFFDVETSEESVGLPSSPPKLSVDAKGESRSFRAIPDKEDPPILPLLLILIGIVVMTLALLVSMASKDEVPAQTTAPPPRPTMLAPAIEPAPRTDGPGQVSEVLPDLGYLSIDSDSPANVYVGDRMIGVTPIVKSEVRPGSHRIMVIEIETGKRKAATAEVDRGSERRVSFKFRPVQ